MFYSDVILSKRGPLGKVWLAAHFERKLNKTAFLQTNIENSVSAIVEQRVAPLALRLSGQLLLGVVRIYSRKAKYLLDDCTDALLKIKMAFRAGAVDLTSDQLAVSKNTITMPSAQTDINIMLPDAPLENWDAELTRRAQRTPSRARRSTSGTPGAGRSHLARQSDITLPQAQYDYNFDDAASMDILSSGMGIASGEFDPDGGLDLGLDLFGEADVSRPHRDSIGLRLDADGNVVDETFSSIGVGRDAGEQERRSVGSLLGAQDATLDDLGPLRGDDGIAFDFGGDSGLGLGAGPQGLDISADFSRLAEESTLEEMTPRTKQQVAEAAQRRAAEAATKSAKERKQLEDRITELQEAQQRGRGGIIKRNVDDIIMEEQYLPRSSNYAALLDIHNDPASHFAAFNKDNTTNLFAGSDLDLAPELSSLFVVDLEAHRAAKRARYHHDDPSMEIGRRAAPGAGDSVDFGFGGAAGDESLGLGGGDDMLLLDDMPPLDMTADESALRKSERLQARALAADEDEVPIEARPGILAPLSRLSTPSVAADEQDRLEVESFTPSSSRLLAAFDVARPTTDAEAETSTLPIDAEDANTTARATAQGWSKNTVRAQRVIRSQQDRSQPESSTMSFEKVAENASRRAAAGFFFELLVLGTKDHIEIKQDEPYGDIQVKGKEPLWA